MSAGDKGEGVRLTKPKWRDHDTACAIDEFGFAVPLAILAVAAYLWRQRNIYFQFGLIQPAADLPRTCREARCYWPPSVLASSRVKI